MKKSIMQGKKIVNLPEEDKLYEQKQLIDIILKEALDKTNMVENLDELSYIEKIKAGIPMRLKSWLDSMFVVYYYGQFLVIANNMITEVEKFTVILDHDEDEWEVYKIPSKFSKIINEEDYEYFVNNIYNKLIKLSFLTVTEKSTLAHMKTMLEDLI